MVSLVSRAPKTEDVSVGPVLSAFFRSRPNLDPTVRPEDSVELDQRQTELPISAL